MELSHDCYEIVSRIFSGHLHHIFLDYNYWSYNGINTHQLYYMNGLNKLSKYTTQLTYLFLLDYTSIFLCSLMTCNSTTDESFASYNVYFLFIKNCHIMFILELSNQSEKGIWDLFSLISCQTPLLFAQDGFVPNEKSLLWSRYFVENCF